VDQKLYVEVRDAEIIVTMTGTTYTVTYFKPKNSPQLLAKDISSRDDPRVPMRPTGDSRRDEVEKCAADDAGGRPQADGQAHPKLEARIACLTVVFYWVSWTLGEAGYPLSVAS
jgi:hypothetical protein